MSGLDTVHRKISGHTRGEVSGSINSDPLNSIYTSQQSTKISLCVELEWYFISIKAINWCNQ